PAYLPPTTYLCEVRLPSSNRLKTATVAHRTAFAAPLAIFRSTRQFCGSLGMKINPAIEGYHKSSAA
ncbi:MAG: hypothetical protein ACOVNV_07600, partial [Pirellulaceae bacterium]